MPEFYSHLVNVTKTSANKLRNGAEGMIKKVGSGVSIHLSEANHAKCMKAYEKGKGCKIKLSAEEIKQNDDEVEGSGFFKTLNKMGISRRQFMKGTKAVAKVVAPLAKQVLPQLGEQAGMALGTYASKSPMGGVMGAQFGKTIGNEASNALTSYGNGFHPVGSGFRPAGRSMIGTGIGTLRPAYPEGYSNIAPINHPVYKPVPVRLKFGM
jgi:hypothetical protein